MEREGRLLSPLLRRLVAVGPFVLAAGLVLLFDVMRDIPLSHGCGEDPPAGREAAVAAYRSGATALHLIAIGWTLVAIALLSARRERGPLGIGRMSAIALALVVAAAPLAVLESESAGFLAILPLLVVAVGLAWLAVPLGAQATGIVAALVLLAAGHRARRVADGGSTRALRAALWVLPLLIGAHLLIVESQGRGPFVC